MERRLQLEEEMEQRKRRKSELKKIKKGRKGSKEGSMKLPGRFQGRVYDVGEGVGSGVGVGNIRCGDGATEIRPASTASPQTRYDVHLITPAAAVIDNPSRVRLVVYSCDALASSCSACVGVNASFECGWCEASDTCTTHAHCTGTSWISHGRSCYSEDHPKKLHRDSLQTAAAQDNPLVGLGEPMEKHPDHPLESHLEDLEFSPEDLEAMDSLLDSPQIEHLVEEDRAEAGGRERRGKGQKKKNGKKKNNEILRSGEAGMTDEEANSMINDSEDTSVAARLGTSKKAGKKAVRVKSRGRSFLRLPQHQGLFIARDDWRLHTGRQYYVPVTKKTLINLGFVRQVIYGSLAEEKSRTVLINGAWKKAAGYFVDLFEKVDHDPVTSLITTSRRVFEQILVQLTPPDGDSE
ncbi:uncharacterized protein LOC135206630 isoform X1 [Macrobrachium nipponense]|uniref:uncharacterized protein LOC135206630 isoform X1 n=1 Tax=Macrobrachium nipponense TaxID=159736 RepID=UPI0030C7C4A8